MVKLVVVGKTVEREFASGLTVKKLLDQAEIEYDEKKLAEATITVDGQDAKMDDPLTDGVMVVITGNISNG